MPPTPHQPRVLHVTPFASLTGANRSTLVLISELSERFPTFVVPLREGAFSAAVRETKAVVLGDNAAGRSPATRLGRLLQSHRAIVSACREHGVQIIHNNSARAVRFTALAALQTGAKLVTHQRDNYARDWFHLGMGRSDRIIAISSHVASTLPSRWSKRVDVIYNAVGAPKNPPGPRRAGPLRIGAAGRCVPEKGFDLLIEAATRLPPESATSFHLWGFDGSAHADRLREKIDASPAAVRARIFVEPFRNDIEAFYASMDVVVVPSRYPEPFGRMAIEAMAYGRPAIVADHGGLPEIVEHGVTGLCFEPNNPQSLAAQVSLVESDEGLLRRLGEAGRRSVAQRFSPAAHADAVTRVYADALGAGH